MRKILMVIVLVALLSASFAMAAAQETTGDNRDTCLLYTSDAADE